MSDLNWDSFSWPQAALPVQSSLRTWAYVSEREAREARAALNLMRALRPPAPKRELWRRALDARRRAA